MATLLGPRVLTCPWCGAEIVKRLRGAGWRQLPPHSMRTSERTCKGGGMLAEVKSRAVVK